MIQAISRSQNPQNKSYGIRKCSISRKSTWSDFEQPGDTYWKCSILGHFKKKCICPHAKNISFTCFLGHFKEPPVNELELYRINVKIFDDKFMFAYSADSEILLNIASIYIFILLFKTDRFLKFSNISKI